MLNKSISSTLILEEKRAAKLFLWLFYVIYFAFDVAYYYLVPNLPWMTHQPPNNANFILYGALIILLPISIYLLKKNKPYSIKYIFFFTYSILSFINEIWFYSTNDSNYASGNVIEVVIILFSPIFINKKYFNIVFIGTILKLSLIGLVLQDFVVLVPIFVIIIFGIVAYIILHRFLSYVGTVKQSYDQKLEGIVKGVTAALELKDPYTKGHSERVANYSLSLAKETGRFSNEQLKYFYYAVLLHDIGKVNIPDHILSKPGKLTDEEFDIIKTHPVIGAEAVKDVEGIADYIDVIMHHHERWDGRGYPSNLKGENIPYVARITAIADAFDAMTSTRSYRPALPFETAFEQIINGSGSQFDPDLVKLFKIVYPSWIKVKQELD